MYSAPSGVGGLTGTPLLRRDFFVAKMSEPPRSRFAVTVPPLPGVPQPPTGHPQTLSERPLRFRVSFTSGFQHMPGQSPMTPQAGHHAVMLGRMSHAPSYQSAAVARAQVSASGTASPTVWQRGHTSVANRWAGLKSSVNISSKYRRWGHAASMGCRKATNRTLKLTFVARDDNHVTEHQSKQVPVSQYFHQLVRRVAP